MSDNKRNTHDWRDELKKAAHILSLTQSISNPHNPAAKSLFGYQPAQVRKSHPHKSRKPPPPTPDQLFPSPKYAAKQRRKLKRVLSGQPANTVSDLRRASISKNKREMVFKRDNYCCQVCGDETEKGNRTIDHIKRIEYGGTNDVANLRTVCKLCHDKLNEDAYLEKKGNEGIERLERGEETEGD